MHKVNLDVNLILKYCLESGSIEMAAKNFSISTATIGLLFRKNGIKIRNFKKEKYDIDYIIKEFKSGKSVAKIAKDLGTYNTSIRRYLLRYGIIPRDQSEAQKVVDDSIFTNLSEEAQYWVGFIAADGGIGNKENNIYLGTVEKDKNHLEKFSRFVNVPIKTVYNKKFCINEYRVNFRSKSLKKWFISIGITPVKSKTLALNIPLTPHILRGILDGDGTITKKGTIEIATASEKFLKQLKDYLHANNINSTYSKSKSSSVWVIRVCKKSERIKLFELLYKDASIYLERKYNRIYAPLFGNL